MKVIHLNIFILKYITTFLLFFFNYWINQFLLAFDYFHFYILFGNLFIIKLGKGMSKFFLIKFLFCSLKLYFYRIN